MLGWDRQQRNLDWHGRLHDKAFEGREMATTPGAGRTVAMKPNTTTTSNRVGVKDSVGGGRYPRPPHAMKTITRFLIHVCYYVVSTVVAVLIVLILVSLFAR